MAIKNYRISHAERMARSTELYPHTGEIVTPTYTESIETSALENGILVKKVETVTKKVADRDKGFTWYDFSIDSLSASGMLSQMAFSQLEQGSIAAADALDAISFDNNNDVNNE